MDRRTNSDVILISIHPEYANAIFSGEKKIEFRKLNIPKKVGHVVLYVTAPERKIVGYFSVKAVDEDHPATLWERYSDVSGTTAEFFFDYYRLNNTGLGLLVDEVNVLQNPISLGATKEGARPPQSFMYVDRNTWRNLKRRKKSVSFQTL